MAKAQLGELERAVFDVLWAAPTDSASSNAGWLTVREVHANLSASRNVAYTTVMTVMDRLARKNLVEQLKSGRAYRYRPRATRSEMISEVMHDTLADFGEHDRQSALVAFVEDASPSDLQALRDALDRIDP